MKEKSTKRNKKYSIFRAVVIILVSLCLGVSVYLWNAGNVAHNKMPMPFGVGLSNVLTGSMEPSLSAGDLIIVRSRASYEKGDIVVFQSGNELIVHRIVNINEDTVTTKGDANNISDEPVSVTDIKGKVIFKIRLLGKAAEFMKTPVGIVLLISTAVILMELSYRNEKNSDNEELEKILEEIKKLKEEKE